MKPLSKKVRFASMTTTFVLFLIIAPLVWAYSVGYRLDDLSDSFGWIRTGGIYINSDITNTDVFVNGKFIKSGGFLLRNIFIQNLRADEEYVIEVNKNGYHSWRKKLSVVESYVTEARTLMLPIEIDQIAIYPYFDENGEGVVWPVPDSETEEEMDEVSEEDSDEVSVEDSDGASDGVDNMSQINEEDLTVNPNYLNLEILFDLVEKEEGVIDVISNTLNSVASNGSGLVNDQRLANNTELTNGQEEVVVKDIPEYFADLEVEDPEELNNLVTNNKQVAWIEDGNIVIHWVGEEVDVPYYYCNLEICRTKLDIKWETEIQRFNFLPGRSDVVVLMNESGIWATELDDRSTRNIQPVYLGQDLDFRINENNRIVVLDEGIFYELSF